MTPLERLKELNEKATPGPWESRAHEGMDEGCRCMSCWHTDGGDIDAPLEWESLTRKCGHCSELILGSVDSELIAATRNLLPELLALWEAVQVEYEVIGLEDAQILRSLRRLNARADAVLK